MSTKTLAMASLPPSQGKEPHNGIKAGVLSGPVLAPTPAAPRSSGSTATFAGDGPLFFQHLSDELSLSFQQRIYGDCRDPDLDVDGDPRCLHPPDPDPNLDPDPDLNELLRSSSSPTATRPPRPRPLQSSALLSDRSAQSAALHSTGIFLKPPLPSVRDITGCIGFLLSRLDFDLGSILDDDLVAVLKYLGCPLKLNRSAPDQKQQLLELKSKLATAFQHRLRATMASSSLSDPDPLRSASCSSDPTPASDSASWRPPPSNRPTASSGSPTPASSKLNVSSKSKTVDGLGVAAFDLDPDLDLDLPRVVCVLDAKSFPALFDTTKVEKKDVLIGTFMPSTSLTGGYRVCAYLDQSEPNHGKIKQLILNLIASRKSSIIPTPPQDLPPRPRLLPISAQQQQQQELDTLLAFKQSLTDPLNSLSTWDPSRPNSPCSWRGIACLNFRVVELRLFRLHLLGPIFPCLAAFLSLSKLRDLRSQLVEKKNPSPTVGERDGDRVGVVFAQLQDSRSTERVPKRKGTTWKRNCPWFHQTAHGFRCK